MKVCSAFGLTPAAIIRLANVWRLCGIPHKRHTYAVRTLLDAYRSGEPAGPRLASLSTYLGHSDPSHSYWYLEAVPELMTLAADRLEEHLGAPA